MGFRSILFVFVFICSVNSVWLLQSCLPRHYKDDSFVCVCNSTYCDSFADYDKTAPGVVTVFQSDKVRDRFEKRQLKFSKEHVIDTTNDQVVVTIDRNKPFQTILGFGGAFTDSTGINILKLDAKLGANVIKDYFGQHGLRYSMGRVPIGGTDFSTHAYSYDDTEHDDLQLAHFKLANEDLKYKIPLIKMAMHEASHSNLKLFASPWSAPAWMKTNHKLNGNGGLKGNPSGTYYHAWADYFVKFLDEYKKNGVEFWGITVQNEPSDGSADNFTFNCMAMSENEQRDFIFHTLGPKLHQSGYGSDKLKIMIYDDQVQEIRKWADAILSHPDAAKYVAGIAFHWYFNMFSSPDILDEVHGNYSNYFLLSTEACEGFLPIQKEKVLLGSWQRAENYAHDIISDLQHHTSGWIDWNLALDLEGGPNWVGNFVDSPIIVNATANEYYKQPMYYALGHFTRFISPGSKRLSTSQNKDALEVVVFTTSAHSTVAVVLNKSDSKTPLQIIDPKYGNISVTIDEHSIQTFVWFD